MRVSRLLLMLLLIWSELVLVRNPACAQPKGPARPPSISPYIALTGSGTPATNYFTIVRPTLETRAVEKRQQSELGLIERKVETLTPGTEFQAVLPRTGHKVYFQNFSHYYPRPKLSP